MPLLYGGKRVSVVMHRYGGLPDSAAACGLSEEERSKEGLKGGSAGLVYNAAFVIPAWKACLDMEPPPLAGFELQESVSHTFRSGSKSTADINLEPRVPAISTSMHQMSILNSSPTMFDCHRLLG